MKHLYRNLFVTTSTLGLLVGMTSACSAQDATAATPAPLPGRTFVATSIPPGVNLRFPTTQSGQTFDISAKTVVNILPYLYAQGNLDVEFTVDGWGKGTSPVDSRTVRIFHNMELTLGLQSFANPVDLATKAPNLHTIAMNLAASITPVNQVGAAVPWFPIQPVYDADRPENHNFNLQTLNVFPGITGGSFLLELDRQITVTAADGPAKGWTAAAPTTYINKGMVTLTTTW